MSESTKTPYEILGVSKQATQDEIKSAYRKLAKKLHPDLNPGNKEAEKKFKEVNGAYEAVGTPESRAKYDQGGFEQPFQGASQRGGPFYHETQHQGGRYSEAFGQDFDANDYFRSFFESAPPQDERYELEIDFKDAVLGAEKEIHLPNGKKLKIKIPAGIESGTQLRLAGQGTAGRAGAPSDAYVRLTVKPSPTFKRLGQDLELELPISISEAVLGAEVKVPTIDGAIVMKIPAGTSSGKRMRVAGKGVPIRNTKGRGDQIVIIKIVIPDKVDDDFKKAVESWSQKHPFNPRQERESNL